MQGSTVVMKKTKQRMRGGTDIIRQATKRMQGSSIKIKKASQTLHSSAHRTANRLHLHTPKWVQENNAWQRLKQLLRGMVMCVMILISVGLFYILIIMGDTYDTPSGNQGGEQQVQMAALPKSPLVLGANAIKEAQQYFSGSIMRLAGDAVWQLEDIIITDDQPAGVGMIVREVRLRYTNGQSGSELSVSSLTPSRYLQSLPMRGLEAVGDQQAIMANMRAVLMSNGTLQHAHAQNGENVYQIEGNVTDEELRSALASAAFVR